MKFWNKIKSYFTKNSGERGLPFGELARVSRSSNTFSSVAPTTIVGRRYSQYQNKDLLEIRSWDHESILKVLRTISPEASLATTTFLRVFDSGYNVTVFKTNGNINEKATALLLETLSRIHKPDEDRFSLPKDLKSIALKFAIDSLFKGAVSGELVLDKSFKAQAIVYIDPWAMEFTQDKDGRYYPYQYQDGKIVPLDFPNVVYIPVDPMGDDPYGEEQIASAIQAIFFKTMLMQDLQRVVHVNGWDRMTFKVLEEAITKNLPPAVKSPDQKRAFVLGILNQIKSDYENIDPDANIVHTDSMEVNKLNTASSSGMFNPSALLDVIDNQIANGLKTFSVLLSKKFGGGSEGFTSSEMILYIKIVAGFQNIVERFYNKILAMILRYEHGIIADVEFKFKKPELRTDNEMSQWKRIELENIGVAYDEQSIGLKEKRQMIREVLGLQDCNPDDLAEERVIRTKGANDAERPSESEEEKERKRKERNRKRRSGQGE